MEEMASTTEEQSPRSSPRHVIVRTTRAFSQLEEPTTSRQLDRYFIPSPAARKTVEIRRLVSPTKKDVSATGTRTPPLPPKPTAQSALPIGINAAASDGGYRSDGEIKTTTAAPNKAAKRKSAEWREEAERLNIRVQELELENFRLKNGAYQVPPKTFAGGEINTLAASGAKSSEVTPTASVSTNGSQKSKLTKSQSSVSGFGFTGRTVQEAAAASHRARSRRLANARKPANKYRSGYWNGTNNVTSSYSCNNLADMEQRELALEQVRTQVPPPPPQHPVLEKSHSTNTRSIAKANRDAAALMNSFAGKNDSLQQRSNSIMEEDFETMRKRQMAIKSSFHAADVARQSSSVSMRSVVDTDIGDDIVDDDDDDDDEYDEEPNSTLRITSPRSYFEAGMRTGGSFKIDGKNKSIPPLRLSSTDVRVWVGTWNMGAADPFIDGGGIIDEQRSAAMFQHFIPHGYELYVLGIQEGVSENVYHATEAYLNRNNTGTRYYRMELKNSDFMAANKNHPMDAVIDAVHGRGDGAFVGTKFTGIAVFYCSRMKDKINLLRAGVHKFNFTSGSKGGVAVALMINHTTIVFVNCHLDARNDSYRREQIRNLNANLGKIMGHHSFDLTEQFHHVVWMGDMNYRIVLLDPEIVLHMLEEGRNLELHDKFDGLLNDRRNGGVFEGFTEPSKFPDFYPTYKKFPKRGYVNESKPSWPSLVYRVLYKEPFYKGGKVKKRVPGWCDRILIHSLLVSDSKLMPEKVQSPFQDQPVWIDNYQSVNHGDGMDVSDHSPVFATFVLSFTNQGRVASNFSPDGALLRRTNRSRSTTLAGQSVGQYKRSVEGSYFDQARVVRRISAIPNRPVSTVLRVFNMQLYWNDNVIIPKKTRVVAPLIGEDVKQCDVIGERCQGANGLNLSLNAVIQHSRPLEQLHMLVWVKNESISGHCTLSLKRIALQEEGREVKFRVPLYCDSMRLYHEGHPLLVVFSVRSKTFAK